jgi:hypothetical protein
MLCFGVILPFLSIIDLKFYINAKNNPIIENKLTNEIFLFLKTYSVTFEF